MHIRSMVAPTPERRVRSRISAMILCEIRLDGGEPELVRIRDFSDTGLKIATGIPLSQGQVLKLRLPGAPVWSTARVAWRAGKIAGLRFLHASIFPQDDAANSARVAPP